MNHYFDTSYEHEDTALRGNRQPWTPDDYAFLEALYRGGSSLEQMCNDLKRPARGVIPKLVQRDLIKFDIAVCKYVCLVHHPAPKCVSPNPQTKEPIMNDDKTPIVQTKTFIGGVDAAGMNDNAIFLQITKIEKEIDTLQGIKAKPKKLLAIIEKKQKDIDDLVAFVDARP